MKKQITTDERIDLMTHNVGDLIKEVKSLKSEVNQLSDFITMFLMCNQDEVVFRVRDAAKFINTSEAIIYELCERNEIPYFMSGSNYRFKQTELIKWKLKRAKNQVGSLDQQAIDHVQKNKLIVR